MSRVGKKPIPVPSGVTVKIGPDHVEVKGPGGTLSQEIKGGVTVTREGDNLQVNRPNDTKTSRALHGLYRQLVANMIQGVVKPFIKKLEVVGVGYNATKQGNDLVLKVGFCKTIPLTPPPMVEIEVPGPQLIIVKGPDKQQVGQFAADVRNVRPPDAYKGKGIRYAGEVVRLKTGKAFVGGE